MIKDNFPLNGRMVTPWGYALIFKDNNLIGEIIEILQTK